MDEKGILKEYPYEASDNDELQLMVDILHHSGTDPETRKEIEAEQEAWRSINAMFEQRERELQEEIKKRDTRLSEQEQELEQERQEKEQREKELEQERQEKEQREKELEKALRELEELKRKMRDE